jgi:hypothetical protein
MVTGDWYGERDYFFSPQKTTWTELQKGVELDASLAVKILTMDMAQQRADLRELMHGDLAMRVKIYQGQNIIAVTSSVWEDNIAGLKGVSALITQPDEKEYLFLAKDKNLIHEIDYHLKDAARPKYQPLIEQILATLRFHHPENKIDKREFVTKGNSAITLPHDWYVKEHRDGDAYQVFISREQIVSENDIFLTGASISKISNFAKNFPETGVTSDVAIAKRWTVTNLDSYPKLAIKTLNIEKIIVAGCPSYLIECSLKSKFGDYYIQEFRLITAKNGALYDVSLEAPVMEFELYRNIFKDAVKSFKPL